MELFVRRGCIFPVFDELGFGVGVALGLVEGCVDGSVVLPHDPSNVNNISVERLILFFSFVFIPFVLSMRARL